MKKNTLVSLFLVACMLFIVNAGTRACAQELSEASLTKEGLSMAEFESVTTYYYQNPQPDKMLSAVKGILTQEELVKDAAHFNTFAHLVAAIAHSDNTFFKKLKDMEPNYTGIQKEALQKIIKETENFTSPAADSPEHLDFLWSEFIATGSEEPVKKIISVSGHPKTGLEEALLIGAAEWSLTSNARQHPKVYSLIERQASSASGQAKEKLEKILRDSKK